MVSMVGPISLVRLGVGTSMTPRESNVSLNKSTIEWLKRSLFGA